jgi:beta-galactosidase
MDVGIAGGDFDNQEAHRTYPMGLPSPQDEATLIHRYCYERGIACGFIHPEDDLSRLKLLYVPHWLIWKDEWTERIRAFAESGGTVILSARTGSRDQHNHIIRDAAPGRSLTALAGVTVEEFGRLAPLDGDGLFALGGRYGTAAVRERFPAESGKRRYTIKVGNREMTAAHMYELLELADGAEARATWGNRFAEGRAAISMRHVGKGRVIYSGTYLTEELVDTFLAEEMRNAGVKPLLANKPATVEVSLRSGPRGKLLFVLNRADEPAVVAGLPEGNAVSGDAEVRSGTVTLPGYGCLVLHVR